DHDGSDQLATRAHDFGSQHALSATSLYRIVLHWCPFRVPSFRGDKHILPVGNPVHGQEFVTFEEAHADDTAGGTAHRAQRLVGGGEPDRLRVLRDEQQVVVLGDEPSADDLVV